MKIIACCGDGAAVTELHGESVELCVVYMQVDGINFFLRFSAGGLTEVKQNSHKAQI